MFHSHSSQALELCGEGLCITLPADFQIILLLWLIHIHFIAEPRNSLHTEPPGNIKKEPPRPRHHRRFRWFLYCRHIAIQLLLPKTICFFTSLQVLIPRERPDKLPACNFKICYLGNPNENTISSGFQGHRARKLSERQNLMKMGKGFCYRLTHSILPEMYGKYLYLFTYISTLPMFKTTAKYYSLKFTGQLYY